MSGAAGTIVGVDVGGTFTDVFVFDDAGGSRSAKAPSTRDAVGGVLAALGQVVEAVEVEAFSFGSTIATNALVERRLARVGVLATRGFRDTLDVRRLWRRDLFGHAWERPAAIVPRRLRREAAGRIDWRGREVEPLAEDEVLAAARGFAADGVEAVAVSFLFSYLNPAHERRAGEILAAELGVPVLLSSEVNPERGEYERTSTTAIAAGLAPIVGDALDAVGGRLAEAGLARPPRVMKSNGGVMSLRTARERPVELVKSGPAGGASAGASLAARLGEPNLILVDIGGTTADVSLIVEGRAARADRDELEWDIPIRVPVVDIRSVGAGGGSIARLDVAGALHVGPESAGATPGPVAYGAGGTEPTVTDAALVCGLIDPEYFLGGAMALDAAAARAAFVPLAEGLGYTVERAAAAVLHLASVEMAALVREMTVDRGLDPREFTLVAFGGAGPLFAGSLLEELQMTKAIVPVGASTLSAMGGAFADVIFDYRRSVVAPVADLGTADIARICEELAERARVDLESEGLGGAELSISLDLRYAGQWHEIEIPASAAPDLTDAAREFEDAHERQWGHRRGEDQVELTGVRLRALSPVSKPRIAAAPVGEATAKGTRQATFYASGEARAPIYERQRLGDAALSGPLIVEEEQTTAVVPPGVDVRAGAQGDLVMSR